MLLLLEPCLRRPLLEKSVSFKPLETALVEKRPAQETPLGDHTCDDDLLSTFDYISSPLLSFTALIGSKVAKQSQTWGLYDGLLVSGCFLSFRAGR